MSYISIDIGYKHLAYASFNGIDIHYNVFDISSNKDVISNLYEVLTSICSLQTPVKVIIEKQVSINAIAREIEYSIRMFCKCNSLEYVIYNPKKKFKYLHPSYDGKRKEHKKISIQYANTILKTYLYDTSKDFNEFSKKDDISDCICMSVFTWLEDHIRDSNEVIKRMLMKHYIV